MLQNMKTKYYEWNISESTWFVGESFSSWPNDLFETNVHKILESWLYWLLTILHWTNTTSVISSCCGFSPFFSFMIRLLVLPSTFLLSGVKSSRYDPILILNVIRFSILLTYLWIGVFISQCLMFLNDVIKTVPNIWYIIGIIK